ncbi:hypothetical protein [Halalkalicoccus sp. NIPERK01]|uniref:HVO_0234 family beta-propeller protein n=1 Tax=Halalkalicoccus sp. NIPERK01 TaxID=3053469 RepID=UPI00256EBC89|nr:hypothetical protein [Halalkalicoccus sp. NIPERK01]MDL5362599.1 hypothetical protein [Halalkalicoccus sp. NIPERK01]
MSTASDGGGFLAFYREYAHTSIHTVTATALTAFGLLTFVHRGFVLLAIGVYVLPPIYLYLTRDGEAPEPVVGNETGRTSTSERSATTETGGMDDSDAGTNRTSTPERSVTGTEPRGGDGEPSGSTTAAGTATDEASAGSAAGPSATERDTVEPAAGFDGTDTNEGHAEGDEPGPDGAVTDADADREAETGPAEWVEADSPTGEALFDAVGAGESAYAVGANGVLLARPPSGDWEAALEGGPAAASTTLRGVDATDDGEAVWVAGDGGALGRYDSTTARHTDHSAPRDITDNWTGLAVAGAAGEERVALINGSGQVLLGSYDGETVAWDEPVKPGSGSSMSAITFVDESLGYCCDTNAGVYRIRESEFERIGIEDASGFGALAATEETVAVASDDGTVQRFDGSVWTPIRVAEVALSGLDTDGEEWLAVGASGTIHENRAGDWEPADSPTEADLFAVAVGESPLAVGEGGTLVERVR